LKVFLSRDQPSKVLADKAKEFGWELTCFSCIDQKLITYDEPPKADWIFFYSPGSVRLYFTNFSNRDYRFAALGNGTAKALHDLGVEPDFVGSFSSPQESVKEFSETLNRDDSVIQARAEDSFQRLRDELSVQKLIDWPFYTTLPKEDFPEVDADYYVLTSPSNAQAYLNMYSLPQQAKIIVFGESTLEVIPNELRSCVRVTEYPGEEYALSIICKVNSE